MARYTDDSRERVRDAVNFEEVVGARTELRRSGANRLEGLCPFHDERSPSFGIDPVQKVYHCFGCGAGGDVFKFVMETENMGFGEALESLAERYRVQLERESEDPRDAERRQRRERLLALLERTAAYFVRVLWESPEAAEAREYLQSRGLEEGALRAYRVGFAPDSWDKVVVGSRRSGYSEQEIIAAGLASRSSRGTLIDRFRGRITFPLADERGRVLGFGARAMKPDDKPKYLNTSESDLFHKGRIVYGADMARAAAAKAGRVVLVEGYTDVIALHQAGVPETVAQMGTALTDTQVDALARLAPKALFCQDPDRAGQESVAKGIAALRSHNKGRTTRGVEFRIVRLPLGQDPADVALRSGGDALRGMLEKAIEVERFEVERILAQQGPSTDEILAQIAPIIGGLSPSILRDQLVSLVADRFGMTPNVVNETLRQPFTAAKRDDMRGGGVPGRGGNPPRSGWSRGPQPPQQGRQQGEWSQPGQQPQQGQPQHGQQGQPRQPQQGQPQHGRQGQPQPGQPGQPPQGQPSQPPQGQTWQGQQGQPLQGQPPQHGQGGQAQPGHGQGVPPRTQPGGGSAPHGASPGGSRQQPAPAAPQDDYEGPPPLEWDGFSGEGEEFDPGSMGPAGEWSEAPGGDPGPAAPPLEQQPPPQQQYYAPPQQDQGWNREWQPRGGGGGRRSGNGGRGNFRGGGRGGRGDWYRNDPPPPDPVDTRVAITRTENNERAFLAFCIALPDQGEQRLAANDLDDFFALPALRDAAAYLRGRLRHPMGDIPSGAETLAHTIAGLVVQSGLLEATPDKFELEELQMQRNRLDRLISRARTTDPGAVQQLAAERQNVLELIRKKLT